MALVTLNGSAARSPVSPAPTTNEYVEETIPTVPNTERIVDHGPVYEPFTVKSALDFDRFNQTITSLRQYIQGNAVPVTYYHKNVNIRQKSVDRDSEDDTFIRIQDFELRLDDNFEYSYLTDDHVSEYTGNAYVYPGLTPHVGDMFLMQIEAGNIGQFVITTVSRLSIRSSTCHRIEALLIGFVTQDDIDTLEERVIDVYFFDVAAYLGESATLLRTQERQLLIDIDTIEGVLYDEYATAFYRADLGYTFWRPDDKYDPYIVAFMLKWIDVTKFGTNCPTQILTQALTNNARSFWTGLAHRDKIPTNTVKQYAYSVIHTAEARNARLTALLNQEYLVLCDEDDDGAFAYISDGLIDLEGDDQTDFDRLVRLYYEQRLIDPMALLEQAEAYHSLESIDQFYRIPIFMYLLNHLRKTILEGSGRTIFGESTTYVPTVYEFTTADLSGSYLIVAMDNNALGVIDNDGTQWMFQDGEVTYDSGNIHANLERVIDAIDGEWEFDEDATTYAATWIGGEAVITVANPVGIEVGMAVEPLGGIATKTRVADVDGDQITLTHDTSDDSPFSSEDVTIAWPVITGTWKLALTGNAIPTDD